jgi:hypothetical protein
MFQYSIEMVGADSGPDGQAQDKPKEVTVIGDVKRLLDLVNAEGKIPVSKAAEDMGVGKKYVSELAERLSHQGLIRLEKHFIKEPDLRALNYHEPRVPVAAGGETSQKPEQAGVGVEAEGVAEEESLEQGQAGVGVEAEGVTEEKSMEQEQNADKVVGGDEKKGMVDNLRKEIAKLEWEEKLLRKRDDRLKWEQEMIEMEEGLKAKKDDFFEKAPAEMITASKGEVEKPDVTLDAGGTYLMQEEKPARSVRLFINEVKNGFAGLYITRSNPKQVKDEYDLGETKVCWLTGVRASEDIPSVSGLQELSILVSNFIDDKERGIILLDGIEYLISNNDFSIVLRLIQQIRDKVSTSDSKMLIPVNPNALEGKQMTLLERECRTIN